MFGQCFPGDFIQAHSFNTGSGAGEIFFHNSMIKTDDLKYLGALVRLQRGDSHLGEYLQQSFIDGFDIIFSELFRLEMRFAVYR